MRAIVLGVLAACTTSSSPPAVTQHGACTALEGRAFTSVDQHECGLGPSGPAYCSWGITFDASGGASSSARWRYSDIEQTLTVTCDGATVTSATPAYTGTYDDATATLTWDGFAYR